MDEARLESMLADATSHCYDAEEEFWAVFCALGLNLSLPLQCAVGGADATLVKLDEPASDPKAGVMAVIDRGGMEQTVHLASIEAAGADWLAVYRHYANKAGLA